MTFIFHTKRYFKPIYWLLTFVINILIILTWKCHWRPFSWEVEEMLVEISERPMKNRTDFAECFILFGTIHFHSLAPHPVIGSLNVITFRNLRFSKSMLVTAVCMFVCLSVCLQRLYRPHRLSDRPDFFCRRCLLDTRQCRIFFFENWSSRFFLLPWKPIAQWWEMGIFQYFDILFLVEISLWN